MLLSASDAQLVLLGVMLLVVLAGVWCWRSRITRPGRPQRRRFHRRDIAIAGGVCMLVLAVLIALLSRV